LRTLCQTVRKNGPLRLGTGPKRPQLRTLRTTVRKDGHIQPIVDDPTDPSGLCMDNLCLGYNAKQPKK
jgi:hypothetical protein